MKNCRLRLVLLLGACLYAYSGWAQQVMGLVTDDGSGEILPFVNIYVAGSSVGTTSDESGIFELKLKEGNTELTFSLLGYESVRIPFQLKRDTTVHIRLKEVAVNLQETVVQGKRENVGKSIMKRVIAQKSVVMNKTQSYSCDAYLRTSMDKWIKKSKRDTVEVEEGFQPVYLNESVARQHFQKGKYKREVQAERKQTGDDELRRSGMTGVGSGFKGTGRFTQYNPIEYFRQPQDANIDLYENQLNNPSLTDRPITSPLSSTGAFVNYKFRLLEVREVTGDTLYVIQVTPRFSQEPLWAGQLTILKEGYRLQAADLTIASNALSTAKSFRMLVEYAAVGEGHWRAVDRKLNYEARVSGKRYQVETIVKDSNFDFAPQFEKSFFNNELIVYKVEALNRDTTLLSTRRPIKLSAKQRKFTSAQDSIWRYEHSPEYYRIQDSIYNRNSILDVLVEGIGWTRREKGLRLYFNSLLESVVPLGVGGYRQRLGGSIYKEFSSYNAIDIDYEVDYGFRNEDWKGRIKVGYVYLPRKFARFYGQIGDKYELITVNQSLEGLFSRSNYVRNRNFGFGHSFEVINGVYLTSEFEYADKQSIDDVALSDWSRQLFGDLNEPVEFERYRALLLNIDLTFNFDQQYITRGRKKIVLGTKYPSLTLKYRKGIPGIGESEVDFDQLEVIVEQKLPQTKFGSTNWNFKAGSFLNQRNLRLLEYRYFRGSDRFLFTNPLSNLQQLGPTLSTPNTYLSGAIIHHFDGFFLDKVPLFNRLQLELLAGAGTLSIPDQSFLHLELYAGIGKKFRLFGETVQFAFYGVTADNSLDELNVQYKIGFNFYNAFSREWIY